MEKRNSGQRELATTFMAVAHAREHVAQARAALAEAQAVLRAVRQRSRPLSPLLPRSHPD